jgi:16S rRNA (cytidine1402-2'-O)-methyltransferase
VKTYNYFDYDYQTRHTLPYSLHAGRHTRPSGTPATRDRHRTNLATLRSGAAQDCTAIPLCTQARTTDTVAPLSPLLAGQDVGIISEAGCPGIADPGAELVNLAHRKGIRVVPLVGPSSILLALMASGLNGQCFAFHGYLPIAEADRNKTIATLETESAHRRQTQLFIETPYRNDKLFAALLAQCHPHTQLCVATDISLVTEQIHTRTIAQWKTQLAPQLNKRPSLFLLLANR